MFGAIVVGKKSSYRFYRLSGIAIAHMFAPRHIESAVGRTERGDRYAELFELFYPVTIGAEFCPTSAAKRKDNGVCNVAL